jgi:hypothetical protein
LWFNPSSIVAQLSREFGSNVSALCAFYRFYYWRTWQRQPLRALEKVARQFSIYYFPKCPAYTPMKIWPLTDVYERAITSLDSEHYRKIAQSLPAFADFLQRTKSLAQNAPTTKQPRLLREALSDLAASYLPLVFLMLILSAIIFWRQSCWQHLRWLAVLVLFGCAYNAASCLEVAIVNSLEVYRYITVQMYATLLTQLLALWLILEFALDITSRWPPDRERWPPAIVNYPGQKLEAAKPDTQDVCYPGANSVCARVHTVIAHAIKQRSFTSAP